MANARKSKAAIKAKFRKAAARRTIKKNESNSRNKVMKLGKKKK